MRSADIPDLDFVRELSRSMDTPPIADVPSAPYAAPCEPSQAVGGKSPGKTFRVLHAADVRHTRTEWIAPGRYVRGGLTVMAGRQGDGKGKVTRDLIARATRGGPFPFGSPVRFKPLTVLDINLEDSPSAIIFPEYEAAGADTSRLHVIHRNVDGTFPNFSDEDGQAQLREFIIEHQVDWVSIDPVGHVFPKVKFNEAESVIRHLGPLMALADELGICVSPSMHFNKGQADDSMSKVSGSAQWTAVARSALAVVPDAERDGEDSERRQLWSVKCNVAPKRERVPWGFEITSNPQGVVVVKWDAEPATTSEATAFKLEGSRGSGDNTQKDRARRWLLDTMQPGQGYRATDLYEQAADADHASWAVKQALQGFADFDCLKLSGGYQKGTRSEWFLAGTQPQDES